MSLKRLFLLAGIAAVVVLTALGTYHFFIRGRYTYEIPPAARFERGPSGPCDEQRVKAPDGPSAPGIDPKALLLSPDCAWIISGNENGSIQVFDRQDGRLLGETSGHTYRVAHLWISPDGKHLFSSSMVGGDGVHVWALPELQRVATVNTASPSESVLLYDAVGGVLITGNSGGIQGWNIRLAQGGGPGEIGEAAFSAPASGGIRSLTLSPDRQFLAAGTVSGSVHLWRYRADGSSAPQISEEVKSPGVPKTWIVGMAFSQDGKHLVSVTRFKRIDVWQVPTLSPVTPGTAYSATWDIEYRNLRFSIVPHASYQGSDRARLIFPLHELTVERIYAGWAGKFAEGTAWRGNVVAMGNSGGIWLLDGTGSFKEHAFRIPSSTGGLSAVFKAAAIPGRNLLAVQRRGYAVSLIDLAELKEVKRFQVADEVIELQASTNERHLAYSSKDTIGLIDLDTWEIQKLARPPLFDKESQRINLQLAPSLDGSGVAAMIRNELVEIGPDLKARLVSTLPRDVFRSILQVPSKSAYLMTADRSATFYGGFKGGTTLPPDTSIYGGIAIAPDGRTLYTSGGKGLCKVAFDLRSSYTCETSPAPAGWRLEALDATDTIVVAGGKWKVVRVVNAADLSERLRLEGHLDEILYVKILGDRVLSLDATGEIRLWSLDEGEVLKQGRL